MSTYTSTVTWQRNGQAFTDNKYSREHTWEFDGGQIVPASSSPHVVPIPMSVEANVDPEEAFIASISSCHMLFFLSIAARNNFIIDTYTDEAKGFMEKADDGKMSITRVVLKPSISWSGGHKPDRDQLEEMHHEAHEKCFIANSVKTNITIDIR